MMDWTRGLCSFFSPASASGSPACASASPQPQVSPYQGRPLPWSRRSDGTRVSQDEPEEDGGVSVFPKPHLKKRVYPALSESFSIVGTGLAFTLEEGGPATSRPMPWPGACTEGDGPGRGEFPPKAFPTCDRQGPWVGQVSTKGRGYVEMCFCDYNVLKYESNVESAKKEKAKLQLHILPDLGRTGRVRGGQGDGRLWGQCHQPAGRRTSASGCRKRKGRVCVQ